MLEPTPGGIADGLASRLGRRYHPVAVFVLVTLAGVVMLTACSVAVGYLLTDVVGHISGIQSANRNVDGWLAARRTPARTDASLIGSIAAGGVVLPIVVGAVAATSAIFRKWRIAGYVLFSLVVESAAYRGTTLLFHEHRPHVRRLESLPVNASYPSGHTAASIAVYGGLILLLSSRFRSPLVRAIVWPVAVAIPFYVALSRMYRGMHYPLDTAGGALLGIAALCVVVFACRVAAAVNQRRGAA